MLVELASIIKKFILVLVQSILKLLLLLCRERLRNVSLQWSHVLDMHDKIKKTNLELQLVENLLPIWLKFQVFVSHWNSLLNFLTTDWPESKWIPHSWVLFQSGIDRVITMDLHASQIQVCLLHSHF
jgi:hypothetical protein